MANRTLGFIGLSAILLVMAGCDPLGYVYVLRECVGNDEIVARNDFAYFKVDFTGEHYAIDNVNNYGFQIWVSNADTNRVSFDLYVSPTKDSMDFESSQIIKNNLPRIFSLDSYSIDQSAYIDWSLSLPYAVNREVANLYIKTGEFILYFVPDDPNTRLDSIAIIITAEITDDY